MRRAALAAAAVATAAVLAPTAGATRECDGLDVCIRVPGPWVAVPPAAGAPSVLYQLSCPRGSIVGGLDAVLGDRALDVVFLGTLGSPVNPGITTGRSAVFVATYGGAARGATAFRPLLGCIPTSGGGGRRTTGRRAAAAPAPPVRRVRSFVLRGSSVSGSLRCAPGERLLTSSHAVAFRSPRAPEARVLAGVTVRRSEAGNAVRVTARRTSVVPRRVRVEIQVHAICGRRG